MSDAELLEHVRAMRHRREVARPVAKAKAERAEKKTVRKKSEKVVDLFAGLSDEEKQKLIQALGG